MSVSENYFEDILVSYQFRKIDVDGNDMCFFKVEDIQIYSEH